MFNPPRACRGLIKSRASEGSPLILEKIEKNSARPSHRKSDHEQATGKSMCGIVGILKYEAGARVDSEILRRMCNTIVHRGPDDEGIYSQGCVGLGMRRLSIIDRATGHQP